MHSSRSTSQVQKCIQAIHYHQAESATSGRVESENMLKSTYAAKGLSVKS
jgi:hypothetical protein